MKQWLYMQIVLIKPGTILSSTLKLSQQQTGIIFWNRLIIMLTTHNLINSRFIKIWKIWKGKHIKFIVRQLLLWAAWLQFNIFRTQLSKGQYFKNNEIAKIYNNGTMDAILILTIFCGYNRMGCLNIAPLTMNMCLWRQQYFYDYINFLQSK